MSEHKTSERSPFWAFQITGWSLLFLVIIGVNLYQDQGNTHWSTLFLSVLLYLGGMGSTALFRWFIKRGQYETARLRKVIPPLILGSLVTTILWSAPLLIAQYIFALNEPETGPFRWFAVWLTLLNNFFVVLLWGLIYFAWHYFKLAQVARIERYRTDAAMRDAQLNTLRGQINPHFMFNSLNNIRALMLEDVDKAREMVTRLSDLLRYSMTISEKREVSLKEELTVVHDFLALCKVQYEDRLHYSVEVDEAAYERRIPPMVLQILVENSVKHGISSLTGGGDIRIVGTVEHERLVLEVSNSGNWNTDGKRSDSNGIGLPNVRKRLKLLYGNLATFHVSEKDNRVIARIEIPI